MSLINRISKLLQSIPQSKRRFLRDVQTATPGMIETDGKRLVDFSSNDYLGLSGNTEMLERACEWGERFGNGARASRLVSGNAECLTELENKIAVAKGVESVLIFGSGFQTNSAVMAALLHPRLNISITNEADSERSGQIRLFTDRLSHASFHFGIAASGSRQHRFHHNDLEHLETQLHKHCSGADSPVIVTESVFSMDGDRANIDLFQDIARRHDALLVVDEAHASGVFGERGLGLMAGRTHRDDLVIGTFGKAFGSYGAWVASCQPIREYLINHCTGLIYSTALPPMVLGAIDWAVDHVPAMNHERSHLQALGQYLRDTLNEAGIDTLQSESQIVPVVVGDSEATMNLADRLREEGFLVGAIRPPTVPNGTSRLRISLSAAHTLDQVDALISAISKHRSTQTMSEKR